MRAQGYQPGLHRYAVLTACLALLPIVVGAVVTTLDAGMAFPDWPSSDGHSLFFYPWLRSAGDKFVEHGHRLAGALIGLVSIGLAGLFWWKEPRGWVRGVAIAVLLAVIAQGLVGGGRVLLDRRVLAMVHGSLAALVFSLMAALAVFTSRGWFAAEAKAPDFPAAPSPRVLKLLAVATALAVFGQFLLGGMLRHLGLAMIEHVGFAFVVLALIVVTAVAAQRGDRWIAGSSWWLLACAFGQIALGAAAWLHKFGFAPTGYVAVHGSAGHVLFRTAHTVVGMLLLMTAVVHAVRVFRVAWVARRRGGAGIPGGGEGRQADLCWGSDRRAARHYAGGAV
jgi:heme a synthase